jgi:putative ABC transport system ATP-binding protein
MAYKPFLNRRDLKQAGMPPEAEGGALIDLRQVVKEYSTPAGAFRALDGVDLQVQPGEFVSIVGKSGSGKSTLLNMVAGIDRPSSGEVMVTGIPLQALSEGELAEWRGRNLGIIFQFFQLLPTLTVAENITLPMEFAGMYAPKERRERALELLNLFGLAGEADKLPAELSGGQQQRVAIARALANDPPLLVADEPTGNLDSKTAKAVFNVFQELAEAGKSIMMVTHDQDLARRADRWVTVADGRIVEDPMHVSKNELIPVPFALESPIPALASRS